MLLTIAAPLAMFGLLDNGETQMKWVVLYKSGIWNAVQFATRDEAKAWAAKYCSGTVHRIVPH